MLPAPRSRACIRRRVMGIPLGCLHGPEGAGRLLPASGGGARKEPAPSGGERSTKCTMRTKRFVPRDARRAAPFRRRHGRRRSARRPPSRQLRLTVPDQAGHDHPPIPPDRTNTTGAARTRNFRHPPLSLGWSGSFIRDCFRLETGDPGRARLAVGGVRSASSVRRSRPAACQARPPRRGRQATRRPPLRRRRAPHGRSRATAGVRCRGSSGCVP